MIQCLQSRRQIIQMSPRRPIRMCRRQIKEIKQLYIN